jgi:uncharacterized protein (DUF488 family)
VLSYACTNLGIRYEHGSGLGIDSAKRKFLVTRADYAELFDEYDRIQLPRRTDELRIIAKWIFSGKEWL